MSIAGVLQDYGVTQLLGKLDLLRKMIVTANDQYTSYLSYLLHQHILRSENFTLFSHMPICPYAHMGIFGQIPGSAQCPAKVFCIDFAFSQLSNAFATLMYMGIPSPEL